MGATTYGWVLPDLPEWLNVPYLTEWHYLTSRKNQSGPSKKTPPQMRLIVGLRLFINYLCCRARDRERKGTNSFHSDSTTEQ